MANAKDWISRSASRLGKSHDWNVPYWNLPSAQEFVKAEKAMQVAVQKLFQLEELIDSAERQMVIQEMGEGHEPTAARLAKARFESSEWQQAWQEFTDAVRDAEKWQAQWREETAKGSQ